MVIKVQPIRDDISVISFGMDEVRMADEVVKTGGKMGDHEHQVTKSRGRGRHRGRGGDRPAGSTSTACCGGRCSKCVATWSSTLPDAVGITGIRYVVNNQDHALRRLLWVVALVCGTAALSYQAIDRISYYISNPKSVDFEVEYPNNLTFPAVTICNFNNFRPSDIMLSEYSNPDLSHVLNYATYEPYLSDTNTTKLYLDLAHKMEANEMYIYALWDGVLVLPRNFTKRITDFGVCYTFNSGNNPLEQKIAGKGHGLSIILDAQQHLYFFSAKQVQASAGFMVAVHDQNDPPQVDSLGVGVAPGTDVRIGLKKIKSTNLPPPHGECASRDLQYYSIYTKSACFQECLINFVNASCGCVEPYMKASDDLIVCNPILVFSCVYTATAQFYNEGSCDCPIPCELTTYTTSLSASYFPSNFYSQQLHQIYTYEGMPVPDGYFIENTLKIEVYFEEIKVDRISQQKAYTFFALLCDLGGALGLWLGGSILTFVEILDHFGYTTFVRGALFQRTS